MEKPHTSPRGRVLDLFCGAGGLSLGFAMAGFKIVGGIDNWSAAAETFSRNHNAPCLKADITHLSAHHLLREFGDIDVLVGGPPCQGFSTAGKRALDDPRNKLVGEFLRLVLQIRPRAFVMENVEGFANFCKGELAAEVVEEVERAGYLVVCGCLNSVNYGVPQRRKRFFAIGSLERKPSLPRPTHWNGKGNLYAYLLEHPPTFLDATSDLPLIGPGERADEYASPPKTPYQQLMRDGSTLLTLHEAPRHTTKMVKLLELIPPGKSAFDILDQIPPHLRPTSGYPNSYKRILPDEPAPTITRNFTTPSSANCVHPFVPRALTLREGARLQSFPDTFEFLGSFTDKRLLIGNAVPPLLAKAVAEEVGRVIG
ncbi:MAG: DNA cytosine methyltransferase [Candidatus Hadarchaeales archaeon]